MHDHPVTPIMGRQAAEAGLDVDAINADVAHHAEHGPCGGDHE